MNKQPKLMSMLESVINILVGFFIGLVAQMVFLPMLGVAVSFRQNLIFAGIMTVISIARSYALRRVFEALHIRVPMSAFAHAVMAERRRQIDIEGWGIDHDDLHAHGDLARAAAAYALNADRHVTEGASFVTARKLNIPQFWPWDADWWKPVGFRRDLVRAAALVIAEGEKWDRQRKAVR